MKLGILHKGLLLVLIPLVVQATVFLQLFVLLHHCETLVKQELQFSQGVDWFDSLVMNLTTGWIYILEGLFKNAHRSDPELFYKNFTETFARGHRIVPASPEGRLIMREAHEFAEREYKVLRILQQDVPDESLMGRWERIRGLSADAELAKPRLRRFESFKNVQMVALAKAQQNVAQATEQIRSMAILGLIAQVVLTIVLTVFFLLDITRRLQRLVRNAENLPKLRPLKDPVLGHDELTYLDTVLRKASSDLINAAERRRFLSEMIVRDIHDPLVSIEASVDSLKATALPESVVEHDLVATNMKRDLLTMIALVEDLLTIDKYESGKVQLNFESVDLSMIVTDALTAVLDLAKERDVKVGKNIEPVEVVIDSRRMTQVISTLLVNAIKRSRRGSKVVIEATIGSSEVTLEVMDEVGVTDIQAERIENDTYQTDLGEAKTSEEMGLALCKLIALRHKGKFGVRNVVGVGCTFWLSMPLDNDE